MTWFLIPSIVAAVVVGVVIWFLRRERWETDGVEEPPKAPRQTRQRRREPRKR